MGPPSSHRNPIHDSNNLSQETEEDQADCKKPGSPSLGDSCPVTQAIRLPQHHLQEPEKQGKPGAGSWPTRGEMKGDVKPMSGKGELRGCGRARLTGMAADGIAATCWHGAGPGRSQTLGTFLPDGTITHWSCLPVRPHHEWNRSHKILLSLE